MKLNIVDNIHEFVNQMKGFEEGPIIVVYHKNTNTYQFIQNSKVVFSGLLNYLSLPINKKFMILSYSDYVKMLDTLSKVVETTILNQGDCFMFSPRKYGFDIWKKEDNATGFNAGPKLVANIKYYSVKNAIAVRFFLNFYSKQLRNLYQYILYNGLWELK